MSGDEWVAYVTAAAELDNSDEERRRVCFGLGSSPEYLHTYGSVEGKKGAPQLLQWTANPLQASLCHARNGGPS